MGESPWRFESSQPHFHVHPPERVELALALAREGLTHSEIARRTGVSRWSIRDWIANGPPGRRGRDGPACPTCRGDLHRFDDLPPAYAYLLGLYLGDGTISKHPRQVYKLRIFLDRKYPGIVDECSAAMRVVMPANRVGRRLSKDNCFEVYSYSRSWPCLFPQCGPGMKHTRPIFLSDWQQAHAIREPGLLLRGLIHSDGCRFENTGSGGWRCPRYSFSNASDDIRRIFCDACDLLGLHWTVAPRTVYVSRKADVARLDEFVGPKS